ncbi:MAG: D-tyrosyl-tRNA(Tyr) deacylase [Prevotellaceae bacterium]|jgi:D-tyrosyl-tRNA(Tyr) deacylase|nr:D-tyrosyl-tRNA(Tyr) deacylase [Prevotellaceae bacterium]
MRVLVQRVSKSSVTIEEQVVATIGKGMLLLVGFEEADTKEDIEWMAAKLVKLRIFDDNEGVMNLSIQDTNVDVIIVSQFTLHAQTKKGNRPSYIKAARPEQAIPLYKEFIAAMEKELGKPVQTGEFGAEMMVELINDGPVTIWIDTKNKE